MTIRKTIRSTIRRPYFDLVKPGSKLALFPVVLSDGNTVAWYDYQKADTITKDGSNYVSKWSDRLGSGRDLVQTTGSKQPLLEADGLLFDGVDDLMQAIYELNQPCAVYLCVNPITTGYAERIISGGSRNANTLYFSNNTYLDRVSLYNGTVLAATTTSVTLNQFQIIKIVSNGTNSKLEIDNWKIVKGNAGATNPAGLTVGGAYDNSYFSNIKVKDIIIRKVADTNQNETIIENYLISKNSVTDKKNVLLIGDSITASLSTYFNTAGNHNVTNIAHAGDGISEQLTNFNNPVYVANKEIYDYTIVMLGMNEYANDLTNILSDYQALINAINANKKYGGKLIVALITPALNAARWTGIEQKWHDINDAIQGNGATPLTGIDSVCTTINPLIGDANYYLKAEYDSGDHVHPNADGYAVIASEYEKLIV